MASVVNEAGGRRVKTRDGWSKAGGRWSHELVAYALDRFHRRHLRTPTLRELRAGVDDLPSFSTIRSLYGTMSSMLRHHGYQARDRGAQPGKTQNHLRVRRDARGRFTSSR